MKKTISFIGIIVTFFILYFLQANFFTWFTIAGVKPNLFILFILFIGLFAGKKIGAFLGLLFGLYLDLLISKSIGISGISFAIMGLLGEYFSKNFSKDSRLTIMLMVIGSTILYEVIVYVFNSFQLSFSIEVFSFIKILILEVIFNCFITIILYPLLQKLGYYIEDAFHGQKILTRYF